jgi:serine O-acetyltransferase
VIGKVADRLLRYLACVEVPPQVTIGRDLVVHHRAQGLVVHPHTVIGDRVHLFQNVTIGVGSYPIWEPTRDEQLGPIVVEDDVWLCSGATVLAGREELRIGRGTVVGAGAILRTSTTPWEIWAGVPARRIGERRPTVWVPPHERLRHGDLIELRDGR